MIAAYGATRSIEDWGVFAEQVREQLPWDSLTDGWLLEREQDIRDQLATADARPGPQSLDPVEQPHPPPAPAPRTPRPGLTNPRTQLLRDLLTAGHNNDVNADLWSERIYQHLLDHQRRPLRRQRAIVRKTPPSATPAPAPASQPAQPARARARKHSRSAPRRPSHSRHLGPARTTPTYCATC